MVTVERYVVGEILKPLGATLGVLLAIFASYTGAEYLADAANAALPGSLVAVLLALKATVALEVLLPITLYFSIIIAVGRLGSDSEITALAASGIGSGIVIRGVLRLAVLLSLVVAGLSLFGRPWAYGQLYALREKAAAELELSRFEAKRFYRIQGGSRVVFAEDVDGERGVATGVFLQQETGDGVQVLCAREARQETDPDTGASAVVFLDGEAYAFGGPEGDDRTFRFRRFRLPLAPPEVSPRYRRRAAGSLHLAASERSEDRAEFQWRLSTGVSALLLALLAVPLSRAAPRRGRYAGVIVATVVFALYYALSLAAKTWVETGAVGAFPGMLWVQALLAVGVFLLLRRADRAFRLR